MIKVSIQIPTYNQQQYIVQAVQSCLQQTYPNIEIIIADDCSTDNTKEALTPLLANPNVKYIRNEKNLGRIGNYRKSLLDYCSGEWVLNLDGDDYLEDTSFIENAIKLVQKNPTVVFLQGNHHKATLQLHTKIPTASIINEQAVLLNGNQYFLQYPVHIRKFCHAATLFNRQKALQVGFYTQHVFFTDLNSMLKLALQGDVILLKKEVANWRRHDENASHTLSFNTIENEFGGATNAYEFAKPILPKKELEKWHYQLRDLFTEVFIECNLNKRKKLVFYLLRNFKARAIWIKFIIKAIAKKNN